MGCVMQVAGSWRKFWCPIAHSRQGHCAEGGIRCEMVGRHQSSLWCSCGEQIGGLGDEGILQRLIISLLNDVHSTTIPV